MTPATQQLTFPGDERQAVSPLNNSETRDWLTSAIIRTQDTEDEYLPMYLDTLDEEALFDMFVADVLKSTPRCPHDAHHLIAAYRTQDGSTVLHTTGPYWTIDDESWLIPTRAGFHVFTAAGDFDTFFLAD